MNADHNILRSLRGSKRQLILITLFLVASAFAGYRQYTRRPQKFIHQWSQRFATVNSLEAAKRLEKTEPVIVRVFASGEWVVATCEYSCCSGAGFDATVIRDSTGATYANIGHNFCGIEGLGEGLGEDRIPATSLPAFYSGLSQISLQRQ